MENFEYIHKEDLSNIDIPDDVIAVCAINATLKTKGVIELVGGLTDSLSENLLKKELLSKGIKVNQDNNNVVLDVFVVVKYKSHIPQVAWDIQENVKKEVENITERNVKTINIHIQDVKRVKEEMNEQK